MKLSIAKPNSDLVFIDVDEEAKIEDLKILIEVETGTPIDEQVLTFQGRLLRGPVFVLEAGLLDGDVVSLSIKDPSITAQANALLQQSQRNPDLLRQLVRMNPPLAEAIRRQDVTFIEEILMVTAQSHRKRLEEYTKEVKLMNSDPFDMQAQMEIERRIQQENIDKNYEFAHEYMPEVFASVYMLYIPCKVNNVQLQAFVDSGAQSTIMSKECAERVGIMRLIDRRFQGEARGVGVGKIIGRIHAANLEIGGKFFMCSFTILESSDIDMLFGLDMLRRHQCSIDLHLNALTLNAGEIVVPFLSEAEINSKMHSNIKSLQSPKPQQKPAPVQPPVSQPSPPVHLSRPNVQSVQQLISLGFTQREAEEALKLAQGNFEIAASLLFQSRGGF
jgi:DNA damage-inducible protein 1